MRIEIDYTKSIEANASDYEQKAKKAKRKLSGLLKALNDTEKKIVRIKEKKSFKETVAEKKILTKKRKREWFEKFHWSTTSNNLLLIGGRDETSNEILVKNYLEKDDLYFHADIQGAAHVILKTKNNTAPETSLREAATFSACYSKAWQNNYASVDVYSVLPEQVSKKAMPGEFLGKGAFMIYGKRVWYRNTPLVFALGLRKDLTLLSGSPESVKKHCKHYLTFKPGREKKSLIAKSTLKLFEEKTKQKLSITLDEIISMLPGDVVIVK
ncbi:MAG: NFACT RNA binding domain-containing protein [archaeon]